MHQRTTRIKSSGFLFSFNPFPIFVKTRNKMKSKGLTLAGLMFAGLFFAKGANLALFGRVPSWLVVFLPLILEAMAALYGRLAAFYGWEEKLRFTFWKTSVERRTRQILKTKSANPGNAANSKSI